MKWRYSILAISLACGFALSADSGWKGMKRVPRLQGSRLLVGYPPGTLVVTGSDETWDVAHERPYLLNFPSLSRDGNLIATVRLDGPRVLKLVRGYVSGPQPMVIATYSLQEKTWTLYTHLQTELKGSISIARDGSKVAFAIAEWDGGHPVAQNMHVIDLKSRAERLYPIHGWHEGITVSWSPDGKRIVYDTMPKLPPEGATEYLPEIWILDLESGTSTKIANGNLPSWSPSGEWIAFMDCPDNLRVENWHASPFPSWPNRLLWVRADGTGSRVLLKKLRYSAAPPVWSPDSKSMLLTPGRDMMSGTVDIKLLDVMTGKLTTIVKAGPPVFGWAAVE